MIMEKLPDRIESLEQLIDVMSRPYDMLVEYVRELEGDIMILGAGGKVGPALARMAWRAVKQAGVDKRVIAVARREIEELADTDVEYIQCDMLDWKQVQSLPDVENIIYLAGRKFGSTGSEALTWATNAILPYHVSSRFAASKVVMFSTGCVYPVMHVYSGGATEDTPMEPVGEYAMSCVARERIFDYCSETQGQRVVQFRLNYAVELRYGVLVDVATKVYSGEPVDLTTGFANVIWQGDVCNQALLSLQLATSPSSVINVTGPETVAIRQIAEEFGKRFKKTPQFTSEENGMGYLSNASKANSLFGNPRVPLGKMIDWIAHWIELGGESIGKPTHFEAQNGKY